MPSPTIKGFLQQAEEPLATLDLERVWAACRMIAWRCCANHAGALTKLREIHLEASYRTARPVIG